MSPEFCREFGVIPLAPVLCRAPPLRFPWDTLTPKVTTSQTPIQSILPPNAHSGFFVNFNTHNVLPVPICLTQNCSLYSVLFKNNHLSPHKHTKHTHTKGFVALNYDSILFWDIDHHVEMWARHWICIDPPGITGHASAIEIYHHHRIHLKEWFPNQKIYIQEEQQAAEEGSDEL